jgi:hypothetical protein
MQSAAAGAMPTVGAATAPDATPAGFYGPLHFFGVRGQCKETRLAEFAYTGAAARQLFNTLEDIPEITYPV